MDCVTNVLGQSDAQPAAMLNTARKRGGSSVFKSLLFRYLWVAADEAGTAELVANEE